MEYEDDRVPRTNPPFIITNKVLWQEMQQLRVTVGKLEDKVNRLLGALGAVGLAIAVYDVLSRTH